MKNHHKISLVILLFFSLVTVIAQEKFNHKNQQKNTVVIKFFPEQTTALDKAQKNTSEKGKMRFSKQHGYVKTGITDIDRCNRKLKTTSMKRVFRPAGKFEEKHRKSGLHLWYEITYDHTITVDDAIDLYKKSNQIETAHARYKAELSDGYSNKSQAQIIPVSENTSKPIAFKANNFSGAPNDPEYSKQWHYNNTGQYGGTSGSDINLEKAWKVEKGDARVIVAVMDEEVEVSHPDLKRNMWVNEGEIPNNEIDDDNNGYVDDIHGYNFVWDRGNIKGESHGTHVAGTIAAETNNGIGIAGVAGGTGNGDGVRIMSCAILSFGIDGLEESYVYAADNGAVISNNSWGLHTDSSQDKVTATKAGIDYFIANAGGKDKAMDGGLVIFAAGNEDHEYNDSFPDTYEPVFHVASTNNLDKKSNFSTYGSWVEIAAPGGQVNTEINKGVLSTLPGGKYGYKSGTSMATPHVSGVAALLVSKNYGNVTPNKIKALLQGSAKQIDNLNPGFEGKLGAGRMDAYASLIATTNTVPSGIILTNKTETSVKLDWDPVATANTYELRYKKVGELNWKTIEGLSATSYSINDLKKTTEYLMQLRAKGDFGISVFSERKVFWTNNNNTAPPKNITLFERRLRSVGLKWQEVNEATGYEVSYKKKEDINWTIFIPRGKNRTKFYQLSEKTEYQVRIRSIYGDIFSAYSTTLALFTDNPICNDFDLWDSNKVYPGTTWPAPASLVSHKGFIYENNHWTQNQEPGVSSAWKKLEACTSSDNNSPTVSISTLTHGQVIEQQTLSAITLSANATDSDGTIASIQFEVNDTALTQGNNINWTPSAFGDYTIKVTATDDKGAMATHQISITVNQKTNNQTPTVNITQPNDGQIFEQQTLSAIILSANASDSDGTITSVQFEVNDTLLVQGNNISWTPNAFGDYTIKVTATDDKGATATTQVAITIKETTIGGDCNGIPSWDPSTIYPSTGGVKVSHNSNIYQNKWWTQNNEPGTGGSWGPWEFVEPCSSSLFQKIAYKENFIISPNPATEMLNILIDQKNIDFIDINLYNLSGQQLSLGANKVLNKGKYQVSYDVSSLPKGLYMIKIETKNRIISKKLIIE